VYNFSLKKKKSKKTETKTSGSDSRPVLRVQQRSTTQHNHALKTDIYIKKQGDTVKCFIRVYHFGLLFLINARLTTK